MSAGKHLEEIAARLAGSESGVAFTGAGISTESGISDFRSPGGVWSRHKPVMFQEFLASHEARARYWEMKKEAHQQFRDATFNVGHTVLADLEKEGKLRAVITQNIDGLHQDAGSQDVLELHGTSREVVCLECAKRYPANDIMVRMDETGEDVPACDESDCDGWLKPGTVSFGQSLPADVIARADRLSRAADVFLAIGSSLVVHPAASLPVIAKESGAYLVIINRDETPLDGLADAVIRESIGETLSAIYAAYRTHEA